MIGEKLKEIRENLGLNKKEFAQYIGINTLPIMVMKPKLGNPLQIF